MGGKGEEAAVGSDGDNSTIRESHHWGIGSEGDLQGNVGIPCLATAQHTTYITIGFGREIKNVEAMTTLDANGRASSVLEEEMNRAFTNNISTEAVDPATRD
jgi:hypothetical protein